MIFILPRVFHLTLRFPCVFPIVLDTNVLVSKTRVKTQEKCKKNPKREPNARKCFYIILSFWQKRKSVAFCSRFAHVLLTFCSRFARVLLAFCLRFACVLLAFCLRFACVLLAFCLRSACVLLAFCSRFAHKLNENANQTHSVIWS